MHYEMFYKTYILLLSTHYSWSEPVAFSGELGCHNQSKFLRFGFFKKKMVFKCSEIYEM